MEPAHERRVLAALLFGNFVIGTGVLLPAGMLTELSSSFSVSIPVAGSLMLVSGIVVAIGAPLAAAFNSGIHRRLLVIDAPLKRCPERPTNPNADAAPTRRAHGR